MLLLISWTVFLGLEIPKAFILVVNLSVHIGPTRGISVRWCGMVVTMAVFTLGVWG